MDEVDCVVVGAGVIGLAAARALALRGRSVIIVETQAHFGSGVSSRNSEVVHAGLYYPTGSHKARHCVAGKAQLYQYCVERHVPVRRSGKLVVAATPQEEGALEAILSLARDNGVEDLERLTATQAQRFEPQLRCHAALSSPSTGIVDSHALMGSLLGEAEDHGAVLVRKTTVVSASPTAGGFVVRFSDGFRLVARVLVNAAGLGAMELARRIEGLAAADIPILRYAKGSYFALAGRSPFSRLVYPVPEPGGLGVHLTLDLAGQARFGPDVEWVDAPDYAVDERRAAGFYSAIRRYWPALRDGQLIAAYAGVRPKLAGLGDPSPDFRIDGVGRHGLPGLINLFGIESPGLTAALSIAGAVEVEAASVLDV